MPRPGIRLSDSQELLHHAEELGESAMRGTKQMWSGFVDFALQDNVLEVAVGLMLVAAVLSPFPSISPLSWRFFSPLSDLISGLSSAPHFSG
jgi:hypothetical protein